MNNLILEHIKKSYGNTTVIHDLSMEINKGERLILLGPSGCGKSTLLRMIAGLEPITGGKLILNGQVANDMPAGKRKVSMVFQNYAIYPHMTVKQNIVYGLKVNHVDQDVIEKRLKEALDMLQLNEYVDRKPKDLSGGQRQRVALARAVVKQADFFLLDEPLSNLDAQLRMHSRKELVKIHERYKPTMIYVTHDQVEAMTVGQRIALMNHGDIEMLDTPYNIYHYPANVFCAKFIGSPAMNVIEDVTWDGEKLGIGKTSVAVPADWKTGVIDKHPAKVYSIGIRPEHLHLQAEDAAPALPGFAAQVRYVENYGKQSAVYVRPDGTDEDIVVMEDGFPPKNGEDVFVGVDFRNFHMFDAGTGKTIGWPGKEV